MKRGEKVLVLGAHPEASRFAYKAMKMLEEYGHTAIPINPRFKEVLGKTCYASVTEWKEKTGESADTLTFYMNPTHSSKLQDELVALKAKRAIFNPGAENRPLEDALRKAGVEIIDACTLVMLRTGQF